MIFEPLCLSSYSVLAGEGRSIRVGALSPEEIVQKFSSEGFLGASINDHFTLLGSIKASILSKKINFPFFLSTRIYLNEAPGVTIVCFPLTKAGLVSLNKFLSKSKLLNSNSVSTFVHTVRDVVVLLKLEELRNDTLKLIEVLRSYFFHIYTVRGPFEILPETKNAYKVKDLYSIPIVGSLDVAFFDSETLMLSDCLACILRNKSLDELTVNERFNFTGLFHKPRDYKFYFPPEVLANNLKLFNSLTPWLHLEITQIFPGIKSNTFDLNKYCRQKLSDLGLESDSHSLTLLEKELKLIKELDYEKFFVLCKYIVDFAKSRDILCQGRGAAANSIVCFLLGITVVHPKEIDFLLERFINRVRQEPPDIDIDFESDRRQEIFDFILSRFYGRCALISAVSTFQLKSAVRDIGRAFGIKASVLRELGKHVHYWVDDSIQPDTIKKITAVDEDTANLWLKLAKKLADFPRHLTQHVGGVLFHNRPIWELSPIYMSKDNSRIMIELTKDDVDDLGLVKVDILGLGMLSAIKESLNLLRRDGIQVDLASLRADDHKVFDLLCSGRTIGVFQVESRAQQAMICKLKPRSFYDLVIEVAIVRPGPIVGEVVHPYLRRRQGIEKIEFPSKKIEKILGKTLGVPLFQEQALRLAVEIANFSEEETEGLRKALKTFKPNDSLIEKFRSRLVSRLQEAGYSKHFAEQCANQIKGFSQYGFPESHAASFAKLVYVSAWLKAYYPAHFFAGLLNSQPVGFYNTRQLLTDAKNFSIPIIGPDINISDFNSCVKEGKLVLGFKVVKNIEDHDIQQIIEERNKSKFSSFEDFINRVRVSSKTMCSLIEAGCFDAFSKNRKKLLFILFAKSNPDFQLETAKEDTFFYDLVSKEFATSYGFVQAIKEQLKIEALSYSELMMKRPKKNSEVTVFGLASIKQKPPTAKGVCFICLEDDKGFINLVVYPDCFSRYSDLIVSSEILVCKGFVQDYLQDLIPYVVAREFYPIQDRSGSITHQ